MKPESGNLFDVSFLVGPGKVKSKLLGVRAILGVRSRVFQVKSCSDYIAGIADCGHVVL